MMLIGSAAALVLLAQASDAPAATPAGQPSAPAATPERPCSPSVPDSTTIVICTQRPQGYRLNPDVMEAKREVHSGGRPPRQATEGPPPDCRTVGPFPCFQPGINILSAAATAAEMAKRVASGQEIGSMFETDPTPDEYHLYLEAKARREAEEARKAAAAKARAAGQPQPTAPAEAAPH